MKVLRHELKYYLRYQDYIYARSVLGHLMRVDSYQLNAGGYFIRSLYFDDVYDSGVEDKLAGTDVRHKYRLRIYDFAQDWAKLERKSKYNDYVQKTTTRIHRDHVSFVVAGGDVPELTFDDETALGLYTDFKQVYRRPVVMIDYRREAFTLPYNNIRITFDRQIRGNTEAFDIFDPQLPMRPVQQDGVVVMEIKFNHYLPPFLVQHLPLASGTRSAISKYTLARLGVDEYFYNFL